MLQMVLRPPYNLAQKGLMIVEVAKQASHLLITGTINPNMLDMIEHLLNQMSNPKIIILGNCFSFDPSSSPDWVPRIDLARVPMPEAWKSMVVLYIPEFSADRRLLSPEILYAKLSSFLTGQLPTDQAIPLG